MTEAESPRRRLVHIDAPLDKAGRCESEGEGGWKQVFLEKLAETSNVTDSAASAGISVGLAYRVRRQDVSFAEAWRGAILEAYERLELETLHRLRMGTAKDDPKFDIANALRFLALHKDAVTRQRADREEHDEEAVIASIDAKLEKFRAREENVARLLSEDGVTAPRTPGGDE